MKTPRLSPGKASLLMLGIGTASLMGLPGMSYDPPNGALVGLVSDTDGMTVTDTPVALFDGESLALLEIAHTDEHGRFALQQAPESFHLCVLPDEETGLLPGWALDLSRGPLFSIDITLREGHAVNVIVEDEEGRPIADADVRTYDLDRRSVDVISRARTDEDGRARVLVSDISHIGVFGPSPERLPSWSFFHDALETESSVETLVFELPRGRRLHGRVRNEEGNGISGAVVSAWDERDEWQWAGYRLAEEDGAFALHAGAGTAEVRAMDLQQEYLPTSVHAGPTPTLDLVLAEGVPVEIVCESADGEALPARVWVWSEESGTWSWGSLTGDDGRITVAGSDEGFDAVARPLYRGTSDATAWKAERNEQALRLIRNEEDSSRPR